MYILTDGKNYVMENPMKQGTYISTTYPIQAKEFTWKQARALLQNRKKSMSWVNSYHMVDRESGNVEISRYKGNGAAYVGKHDITFDDSIIELINNETRTLIGIAGWNMTQLKMYEQELRMGLSKYDSAESDIVHALQKYKTDHNGKRAQAHKMAAIAYLLDEIRDKHMNIKQCLNYVSVFEDAIIHSYTLEKIKIELEKAKYQEYRGRTEYYQKVLELLK